MEEGGKVGSCKVEHAVPFTRSAMTSDHARGGLEFESLRGSPGFKASGKSGSTEVGAGPGWGMKVEVTHKEGGDGGVEAQMEEGVNGGGIVDVVVKGDDSEEV